MPTRDDCFAEGFDHFAAGRMAEAAECYRKAVGVDPGFADAHEALAQTCFHLGRIDEAIEVAKRWAAIDPKSPMPHTSLSIFYQRKGRVPEAEAEGALAKSLEWKEDLRSRRRAGELPDAGH